MKTNVDVILEICSINVDKEDTFIFFKPLKYPLRQSLIPTNGIKKTLDRIGKNRLALFNKFFVNMFINNKRIKITKIDTRSDNSMAFVSNFLFENFLTVKFWLINFDITLFKLSEEMLVNKTTDGIVKTYKLIPSIFNDFVINILFKSPNILIIRLVIKITIVFLKKEFVFI